MKIKKILPNINITSKMRIIFTSSFILLLSLTGAGLYSQQVSAHNKLPHDKKVCGKGKQHVHTKLEFGCKRQNTNPIIDLAYALIRFLSYGVGIVVVASVVFGGIQYTTAEGNPEKSAQAKGRIQTSIMALILYLFIFAIVQYLVPGGLF
jgi:hypothetical protein